MTAPDPRKMPVFTISAFADEISPDPHEQLRVLGECRVSHIELRSIHGTNVLALTDDQVREFKALIRSKGVTLSAIGSPIGKIRIDEPFERHLEKFRRALDLCKVFDCPRIRVFSYYPPDGEFDWADWRNEVVRRMRVKCEIAEREGVTLFHENEHRIYGDSPARLRDLFEAVPSSALQAAYDPANFVFCGYDPIEGWEASEARLGHLHIKDWKAGEAHGSIAGEGEGQVPEIIRRAVAKGYSGFATMEPHLLGGGPTGGQTGPDLFPRAVAAFRTILDECGAKHD